MNASESNGTGFSAALPSETLTIKANINAVNAAPTTVGVTQALTNINENTSTATHIKVGDIAVTDDGLGTNTLSLVGADAGSFEIVGNTSCS